MKDGLTHDCSINAQYLVHTSEWYLLWFGKRDTVFYPPGVICVQDLKNLLQDSEISVDS